MVRKRHHVVSKFYLNLFAREIGKAAKLHYLDTESGRSGAAYTDDLCVKKGFNKIEAVGLPSDAIEEAWSKDESVIAPLLRDVVERGSWVSDDHYSATIYLMAMFGVRTLHFRREMSRMMKWTAETAIALSLKTEATFQSVMSRVVAAGYVADDEVSYDDVLRYFEEGEFEIVPDQTHLIVNELKVIDTVVRLLGRRNWMFLDATPGFPFVTSDRPVSLSWADPEVMKLPHSPGFGMKSTIVLFPLSPNLCLCGMFEKLPTRRRLTPIEVGQVNFAMLSGCERLTLSGTEDAVFSDGSHAYTWRDVLRSMVKSHR